jgi:hypothetical protein
LVLALIPIDALNLVGRSIPGSSLPALISTDADPAQLDPLTLAVTTLLWTVAWMAVALISVRRRNV